MKIEYVDRKTNCIENEKIYGRWALSLLYGETIPARIFSFIFLPIISRVPWISAWYGYVQKQPKSARKIKSFIDAYKIDTSEFLEQNFTCFNDFFIRRLKSEKRPIIQDKNRAVMPADGRYLVFQNLNTTDRFYVKGQSFDLKSFLQNPLLAKKYANGGMVIARLCPTDYHRFHFPTDGMPTSSKLILGPLFSVNPIALRQRLSILFENKRMITEIETEQFGTILYIEIGATCVGTIMQTFVPGKKVVRGDEKGYFSFGGSCIVLLFQPAKIRFDEDLVRNSCKGFETKCNYGTSLGISEELK